MMAAFYNAVSPETHPFLRSGTFDLVFDCMPQRFLKIGEQSIPVAAGSSVTLANPTRKPARPLLSVSEMTSGGSIEIGDQTITVAANSANTMLVDTDLMRAYMVTAGGVVHSLDAFVTMPDNYVEIPAGQSVITATGVSVSVTPRWWKL
jgi:phage-related protein